VIAKKSFNGFLSNAEVFALSSPLSMHGKNLSAHQRKNAPKKIPTETGINAYLPHPFSASPRAGSINDHTEAAIIIPEVSPKNNAPDLREGSFLKKNTNADPKSVVINKKAMPPIVIHKYIFCSVFLLNFEGISLLFNI
jgi:hypothetical protein